MADGTGGGLKDLPDELEATEPQPLFPVGSGLLRGIEEGAVVRGADDPSGIDVDGAARRGGAVHGRQMEYPASTAP
jgi:hypothetical protein